MRIVVFVNFLNIDLNLLIEETKPVFPFPKSHKASTEFYGWKHKFAPNSGWAIRCQVRAQRMCSS